MTEDLIDTILRLGAAAAAGMILGVNRDMADKPIGTAERSALSRSAPRQCRSRPSASRAWPKIRTR